MSKGRPRELTDGQRVEFRRNASDALTQFGYLRVAEELGVTQETVHRWARGGSGGTYRNAIALAKLLGRTLSDAGLEMTPDRQVRPLQVPSDSRGTSLAIRLLQERETGALLFPNLAIAIRYNEGEPESARRKWSAAAIVAAAGGAMGDEDLAPSQWGRALDQLEQAISGVRDSFRPKVIRRGSQ